MIVFAACFIVYGVTALLVNGTIFSEFRALLRRRGWFVHAGVLLFDCRMCTGFWVAIITTAVMSLSILDFFIIFGGSYFLATQER